MEYIPNNLKTYVYFKVKKNSQNFRINLISINIVERELAVYALIYNFIASSNFPPNPNSTIFCKVENRTSFTLFSILEM